MRKVMNEMIAMLKDAGIDHTGDEKDTEMLRYVHAITFSTAHEGATRRKEKFRDERLDEHDRPVWN